MSVIKHCLSLILCVFLLTDITYAAGQNDFSRLRPMALAEKGEMADRVWARDVKTIFRSLDPALPPDEARAFDYSVSVVSRPIRFLPKAGSTGALLCTIMPLLGNFTLSTRKAIKEGLSDELNRSLSKIGAQLGVTKLLASRLRPRKSWEEFAGMKMRCVFRAQSGSPKRWVEAYLIKDDAGNEVYLGDFHIDFSKKISNSNIDPLSREEVFFDRVRENPKSPERRIVLPLGQSGLTALKGALKRADSRMVPALLGTLRKNLKRGRWTHLALENKNITDEFGHCHRVIYGYFAKASDKYDGLEFSPKQFVTVLDSDHPDWLRQGVHSYLPAAELWAVGLLPAGDVPPTDVSVRPASEYISRRAAKMAGRSTVKVNVGMVVDSRILLGRHRLPGFAFPRVKKTTTSVFFTKARYAASGETGKVLIVPQRWPVELVELDGRKFIGLRRPGTAPPVSPVALINIAKDNVLFKEGVLDGSLKLGAEGLKNIPEGYKGEKLYCAWQTQLRGAREAIASFFAGRKSGTPPWIAFDIRRSPLRQAADSLECRDVFILYQSERRLVVMAPKAHPFTGGGFEKYRFILTAPADGIITKQPYLRAVRPGLGAVYFYLEDGKPAVCVNSFNGNLAEEDELIADILAGRHGMPADEARRIAGQLKNAADRTGIFSLNAKVLADSVRIDRDPDITGDKDWAKTLPSGKPVLLVPFDLIDVRGRVVTAGLLVSPDGYTIINRERQPKAAATLDDAQRENRKAAAKLLVERQRHFVNRPASQVPQKPRERDSGV